MTALSELLEQTPYRSYAYAYPHKTAYRTLSPPKPLSEVWAGEDKRHLFLYMHVPFCEMRCGFCNLFTMAKPKDELRRSYVDTLQLEAERTKLALGDASFARMAIGGGTPTQLSDAAFERLFTIAEDVMGAPLGEIPLSCETSPETLTDAKLAIMKERGVTRVSIGVQSFERAETKAIRRPQDPEVVRDALQGIKRTGFDVFNLDLIFGLPHQDAVSWARSLDEAVRYEPEEIFLYPLYVRPLTGLGNSKKSWDDHRLNLYRQGRDHLLERGYEQVTLRIFRREGVTETPGPKYTVQDDGMVGVGVGARSYTRGLHYSTEYAVGRRGVVSIIEDYAGRDAATFDHVHHGFTLDEDEQRRRFVILSLMSGQGLDPALYAARFGAAPMTHYPELAELVEHGLATRDTSTGQLGLTERGMELEDVIGPWLYSATVDALSDEYELS